MTPPASTSTIDALCFDASDPHRQAQFWAAALGWNLDESDDEVALSPNDGTRFGILFEPILEKKTGQNNIHLDLTTTSVEDQQDIVDRLIGLGARHLDIGQREDEGHVVLGDPEGNEFCIIEPHNEFLAGCGRLGAINADGTRKVGQFWSAALGWPLVWDQDEETAIRAPDRTGPLITWSGPPLMKKFGKNRLHLDIAPPKHVEHRDEVGRLIELGATLIDIGQGDVNWVVMADPTTSSASCALDSRCCAHISGPFSALRPSEIGTYGIGQPPEIVQWLVAPSNPESHESPPHSQQVRSPLPPHFVAGRSFCCPL